MRKSVTWTQNEDELLKKIVLQSNYKFTWSKIAQQYMSYFPENHRSGKQCRQRFVNHLSVSEGDQSMSAWSLQETNLLCLFYKQIGPKWSKIAKRLSGRSENCVKNKFYGSLRKAIRRLNNLFRSLYKKVKKQIRFQSIMRILSAAQGSYRLTLALHEESLQLREKILNLLKNQTVEMSQNEIREFVTKINTFSITIRSYKIIKKNNLNVDLPQQQISGQLSYIKEQYIAQNCYDKSTEENMKSFNMQQPGRIKEQNQKQLLEILLRENNKQTQQKIKREQTQFIQFIENYRNQQKMMWNQDCMIKQILGEQPLPFPSQYFF